MTSSLTEDDLSATFSTLSNVSDIFPVLLYIAGRPQCQSGGLGPSVDGPFSFSEFSAAAAVGGSN